MKALLRPDDGRWHDVVTAVEVVAVSPLGCGGLLVRAWPGPVRDLLCEWVRTVMTPVLRLPLHITEDRLLGGLSLASTLETGRVVVERGVLSQADGGVVVVPMSERLDSTIAAHLCAALDQHQLALERDGLTQVMPCRIAVLALDEGLDDEATSPALADRLGVHLDLRELAPRHLPPAVQPEAANVQLGRARLKATQVSDEVVVALCETAAQLGVASLRAPVLAVAVARAHAALRGRSTANEEDAVVAARLVLGPRATRTPGPRDAPEPEHDQVNAPVNDDASAPSHDEEPAADSAIENQPSDPESDTREDPGGALSEVVLAAAKSAIPEGLLDLVPSGRAPRQGPRSAGRTGALRASTQGGRPAGVRAGVPGPGERLNLVATLRAAAPWQALRGRVGAQRIAVRRDDLRVTRFARRAESLVIFCVDASGSSAMQRLAEAKGAVEQVLGDCYVRRDHVALIAFRGERATLLLPPTRSLVRVRRSLADLAGGGATPMTAGIDAALDLALEGRKRGRTPLVVFMTDGRANVGRGGARGQAATDDALASATRLKAHQIRALFLDTSPRPRPQAQALALKMGATYLPLPHLDPRHVSMQVQALTETL